MKKMTSMESRQNRHEDKKADTKKAGTKVGPFLIRSLPDELRKRAHHRKTESNIDITDLFLQGLVLRLDQLDREEREDQKEIEKKAK